MRRGKLLPVAGLVAIALVSAIAVVGVSSLGGDSATVATVPGDVDGGNVAIPGTGLPEEGIGAVGIIQPGVILFGDTIQAQVDVFLDRRKVDPGSIRVSTAFEPWAIVGSQRRLRRDSGSNTFVRTSFTLRCTGSPCLPANESSALEFNPARVSYAPVGAPAGAQRPSLAIDFPTLLVYSRFAAANLEDPEAAAGGLPWRADLGSFQTASYRVPPNALIPGLVALAALLALGGVALAWLAIPRRSEAPEPEPEPEPEPVIVLTPLEQALELLEDASRADGGEDRRRALELVAEVLDVEHPDLARAARTLAWSEDDPLVDQTSGLATRVRTTIEVTGNATGNGRAHP